MTLFFNLQSLEENTLCNPKQLVETLRLHFKNKTIPRNSRQLVKPLKNIVGSSFILNPSPIFADKTTDISYIAQYIRLAGRRDYTNYKIYGHKYLDLSFFLDIDVDSIKTNPLLKITQNKIYFKYEEN
jgi:hypothetical protein